MSRALVTGAAGFIGSHVVDLLLARGWSVRALDDLSTGDERNLDPRAELVRGSVIDLPLLRNVTEDVDYVFHLAALARIQPSFDDPVAHEEANVIGTIRCLEAARGRKQIRKIVVSASSSCYGNPDELPTSEGAPIDCLSPYALQKYAAEQHALILGERYGTPVVALRYFNVYGARSFNERNPFNAYTSVIGIFAHRHARGLPLLVTGDGEQRRDFVHVLDVAKANMMAAESSRAGTVYNVGSGTTVSVNDVADRFDAPREYVPARLGEARITWADTRCIREELGWTPTIDLAQGMGMLA